MREPPRTGKGGTSLSKAFRLIERFSEDIDIFFTSSGLTDADIDAVMAGMPATTTTSGACWATLTHAARSMTTPPRR
ncbi:nucleotidyl transferase AbiEii/AbiGii toxin family protein [Candidatus Poriferisodalis sp.]|uniref:nucleotidyl transferase AbiEii/AbiGii toxin family protein n=1 Tax=Candidatus Poriferisodalis sp. TaxID=3101277 RepID=UPI003B0228E1